MKGAWQNAFINCSPKLGFCHWSYRPKALPLIGGVPEGGGSMLTRKQHTPPSLRATPSDSEGELLESSPPLLGGCSPPITGELGGGDGEAGREYVLRNNIPPFIMNTEILFYSPV